MKPKRIQRKRTKGYKLPAGVVCVTRPGNWGNMFLVDHRAISNPVYRAVHFFRECLERAIRGIPFPAHPNGGVISTDDMNRFRWMANNLSDLRGKDLACWCKLCPKHKDGLPLGEKCDACAPCHADVLLEIANK